MKHYNRDVEELRLCPDCDSPNVRLTDRFYGYAECPDCGASSDPDESGVVCELPSRSDK